MSCLQPPSPVHSSASTIAALLPPKTDLYPSFPAETSPPSPSINREQPQTSLAATVDMVTRLRPSARERELLIASLHSSLVATAGSPLTGDVEGFSTSSPTQTRTHHGPSNLQSIMDSFARLDRVDRRAIVSILSDMITPDSLATPTRLSEPPPPYGRYSDRGSVAADGVAGDFGAVSQN